MNSIVFENVCKSYGDAKIVKSLNLEIKEGERLILLGPSGCGKTTTLRMIAGLEDITSGQLKMGGRVVNDIAPGERNIAMVFQSYALFPHLSVWDNITFGLHIQKLPEAEIKKRADEALEILNLRGYENYKPKQLSGGQKQRVGIARALSTNPSILLCDEATSALDPVATEQILQLLKRINKELGITILIVTHEIDVIQKICNRVAVMELGRVVEQGSVLDVFSDPQKEITKRFVKTVIPNEVPQSVLEKLKAESRPYQLLRVRFLGDEAAENLFYHLNHDLGVETNILFANVCELQGEALGLFIIEVINEHDGVPKAKAYFDEHGLSWKEVDA